MFAAIVGRSLKAFASYHAERGAKLGVRCRGLYILLLANMPL